MSVGGVCASVRESLCVCECVNKYLVLLLLLFAQVAAVGVILDNVLAHVIHSVHQKLKALLQVVAGRKMSDCQSHVSVPPSGARYIIESSSKLNRLQYCLLPFQCNIQTSFI